MLEKQGPAWSRAQGIHLLQVAERRQRSAEVWTAGPAVEATSSA